MHTDTPKTEPRLQTLSREAFWQRHVCQWRDSGMSKMAYCQQYSLVYHQMVYWSSKQKVCNRDEPYADEDLKGFVPVSVTTANTADSGLSIRLPSGLLIHGIDQHNIALLLQVIQQL